MFADGVIESSETTGIGTYTLDAAVGSGRRFKQDFADGAEVAYYATTLDRTKWEFGTGILTWGPPCTLTRATIIKSSNAGAKIDWQSSDTYLVYSIASADALAGLITGGLAAARPWWVRTGMRWFDSAAGLAVSWIDKIATGAAANLRIGAYDVVKNLYFPDARRPWVAMGANNKTIGATDIGGVFTQDNAAADRVFELPPHGSAGVGEGFRVGGLGLTAGGQYSIVLTPQPTDKIEGGADGATLTISGGVRFDVVWDEPGDCWRVEYLNNGPAPRTGRRQTVAAGPISTAGLPTFLPSTNGALSLTMQNVGVSARFVAAAANGFDYQGRPSDRVGVSIANLTWTGLTASRAAATPNFLYVAVNADGTLTPDTTILAPVYQWGGTPATTNGQFTFNIAEMKGYLGNGATAPEAFVVFVGEAATDGSGVISTVAYAYNGMYDSGFTATLPAAATAAARSHNIGVVPRLIDFRAQATTADAGWAIGEEIGLGSISNFDGTNVGVPTIGANSKVMTVISSSTSPWVVRNKSTGAGPVLTLASWKYKLVADRGWG